MTFSLIISVRMSQSKRCDIKTEKYDLLVSFDEVLRVRPMIFINSCQAKINIGLELIK